MWELLTAEFDRVERTDEGSMECYWVIFENGYEMSIMRGRYTYGGTKGLWEIALLNNDELVGDNAITGNEYGVLGWLTEAEVIQRCYAAKDLPPR